MPTRIDNQARTEDVIFLAETGEGLTNAARRLGLTPVALERWATRHLPEVLRTLRRNEPHDHNNSNYDKTHCHGLSRPSGARRAS